MASDAENIPPGHELVRIRRLSSLIPLRKAGRKRERNPDAFSALRTFTNTFESNIRPSQQERHEKRVEKQVFSPQAVAASRYMTPPPSNTINPTPRLPISPPPEEELRRLERTPASRPSRSAEKSLSSSGSSRKRSRSISTAPEPNPKAKKVPKLRLYDGVEASAKRLPPTSTNSASSVKRVSESHTTSPRPKSVKASRRPDASDHSIVTSDVVVLSKPPSSRRRTVGGFVTPAKSARSRATTPTSVRIRALPPPDVSLLPPPAPPSPSDDPLLLIGAEVRVRKTTKVKRTDREGKERKERKENKKSKEISSSTRPNALLFTVDPSVDDTSMVDADNTQYTEYTQHEEPSQQWDDSHVENSYEADYVVPLNFGSSVSSHKQSSHYDRPPSPWLRDSPSLQAPALSDDPAENKFWGTAAPLQDQPSDDSEPALPTPEEQVNEGQLDSPSRSIAEATRPQVDSPVNYPPSKVTKAPSPAPSNTSRTSHVSRTSQGFSHGKRLSERFAELEERLKKEGRSFRFSQINVPSSDALVFDKDESRLPDLPSSSPEKEGSENASHEGEDVEQEEQLSAELPEQGDDSVEKHQELSREDEGLISQGIDGKYSGEDSISQVIESEIQEAAAPAMEPEEDTQEVETRLFRNQGSILDERQIAVQAYIPRESIQELTLDESARIDNSQSQSQIQPENQSQIELDTHSQLELDSEPAVSLIQTTSIEQSLQEESFISPIKRATSPIVAAEAEDVTFRSDDATPDANEQEQEEQSFGIDEPSHTHEPEEAEDVQEVQLTQDALLRSARKDFTSVLSRPQPRELTQLQPAAVLHHEDRMDVDAENEEEQEVDGEVDSDAGVLSWDDETEGEPLVQIRSHDPLAAARAAAILNLHHKYIQGTPKRRDSSIRGSVSMSSRGRSRRSISALMTPSSIMNSQDQDQSFAWNATPSRKGGNPHQLAPTPSVLGSASSNRRRSSDNFAHRAPQYRSQFGAEDIIEESPREREAGPSTSMSTSYMQEWTKQEWRRLEHCFTIVRQELAREHEMEQFDADEVDLDEVVGRFVDIYGDGRILEGEWSWDKMRRRAWALLPRQREGKARGLTTDLGSPTPSVFTPRPSASYGQPSGTRRLPSESDFGTPTPSPVPREAPRHARPISERSANPPVEQSRYTRDAPASTVPTRSSKDMPPPSFIPVRAKGNSNRSQSAYPQLPPLPSKPYSIPSATPLGPTIKSIPEPASATRRVWNWMGSFLKANNSSASFSASALADTEIPRELIPALPPISDADREALKHVSPPQPKPKEKIIPPKAQVQLQHVPTPEPIRIPRPLSHKSSTGSVKDMIRSFESLSDAGKDSGSKSQADEGKSTKVSKITRPFLIKKGSNTSMSDTSTSMNNSGNWSIRGSTKIPNGAVRIGFGYGYSPAPSPSVRSVASIDSTDSVDQAGVDSARKFRW